MLEWDRQGRERSLREEMACATDRTKGRRYEGHIQSTRRLGLAALSLCIPAIASTAEAQGIADSEQLRLLVKPGDTVSVTDTARREVTGKMTVLSSSSLAMVVNGTRLELTEREVATIRQRRSDSLGNGAIWVSSAVPRCRDSPLVRGL